MKNIWVVIKSVAKGLNRAQKIIIATLLCAAISIFIGVSSGTFFLGLLVLALPSGIELSNGFFIGYYMFCSSVGTMFFMNTIDKAPWDLIDRHED